MSKAIEKEAIAALVAKTGYLYESVHDELFIGCPVSEMPRLLRDAGYRVSRFWDAKDAGLRVVVARYVGGARPKRHCDVVYGKPYAFNPAFHAFMIGEGATHERIKEHWEDAGDAENGPELDGYQAHDLYTLDDIWYVIFEDGSARSFQAVPEPS
jgi:hypothetical protein